MITKHGTARNVPMDAKEAFERGFALADNPFTQDDPRYASWSVIFRNCEKDNIIILSSPPTPEQIKAAHIALVDKPAAQVVFRSGATRSHLDLDLTLIPEAAENAIARRFGLGIPIHGRHNWLLAVRDRDRAFQHETLVHLRAHVQKFVKEGKTEDLDAIITNAAMLCTMQEVMPYPGIVPPEKK